MTYSMFFLLLGLMMGAVRYSVAVVNNDVSIVYLKDHQEHIPMVISWICKFREFFGQDPDPEGARTKVLQALNIDKLPVIFLALVNKQPVGMSALYETCGDMDENISPWLRNVFVLPEFRWRGIGKHLVDAVTEKAHAMGYNSLYVYTTIQERCSWYEKAEFSIIKITSVHEHTAWVMKRSLGGL